MPFFTGPREARRYAQARPYFHPIAIERAKEVFGIESSFPLGMDIACGTGQSAAALTAIAERVIGLDISWNMLAAAGRNERTWYVQAQAESIPLKSGSVPLLSCALAFHWFDREQFLHEAWRVLHPGGLFLIYNNGFLGIMRENPAFDIWGPEVYGKRYPPPPRDSSPFTKEVAGQSGFVLIMEESYENEISFTPHELAAYLTTQTNVVAALDQGQESLESITRWLLDQIKPIFTSERGTFVFVTKAWYLRKKTAG